MKLHWSIVFCGLVIASCNPNSRIPNDALGTEKDVTLPKLEFTEVRDGALLTLSNDGKLVTASTGLEGYRASEVALTSLENRNSFWYLRNRESQLNQFFGPTNSDLGNMPALSSEPLEAKVGNQTIGLIPLRLSTEQYRYYRANKGFYAGDRKNGQIFKISDESGSPQFLSTSDSMILATYGDHRQKVIRIGPHIQPEILCEGIPFQRVLDVDSNGDVMLLMNSSIEIFEKRTKQVRQLQYGNFDAKFFHYGKERFIIGFATIKSPDKTNRQTSAVIWSDQRKPISFSVQCPQLKEKIVHVDALMNARILCNKNGWIAIEMSGRNPDQGKENDLYLNWKQVVERTYLLKLSSSH